MSAVDYRKQLTERIIEQLEAGTAPWVKPWNASSIPPGAPHNAISLNNYRGGNRLWLDCQGYADPRWCTYKQAAENGWQVRKGERATVVEYWQWEKEERNAEGQRVRVKFEAPRVFFAHVFNATQMNGVPERVPSAASWPGDSLGERVLAQSGAALFHDQAERAFYRPATDSIHLPPRAAFEDGLRYYATALHELGHWTGHASRLNRDLAHRFGSPDYAREELRAELASYFISSNLGLPHDPGQHAAYLGSWIMALRKDHNELFRAAKEAEQITEYVLQFTKEREVTHAASQAMPEEEQEC